MVLNLTDIKNSQIFRVMWEKYGKELKKELVTMEIIFSKMWSRICKELQLICQQFHDGKVKLREIDECLNMFKMDYDALIDDIILLSRFFKNTAQLEQIENKLVDIMEKVKSYKKLVNARQAAHAIVNLENVIGLKGDFSQVRNIEKVWHIHC